MFGLIEGSLISGGKRGIGGGPLGCHEIIHLTLRLLPRASASLLLSGAETQRFGFLELQLRRQPKEPGAGATWRNEMLFRPWFFLGYIIYRG